MFRRSHLLLSLSLLATAAACGKSSTEPEPPPPTPPKPVAAVVTLKDSRVLVFTGKAIPLRALVLRVTDAQGAAVPAYTLAGTAGGGCAIRGDSLVASGSESVCRVKLSATYLPAARASFAPLFNASSSAAEDTATVTSVVDLKSRKWRVSFKCSAAGRDMVMTDANVFIDSMHVQAVAVDSIRYAADSGWIRNYGGVAQVWVRGPMVRWLRNGVVDTVTYRDVHTIHRQAPDTLLIGHSNQDREHPSSRSSAPGQLLRYDGGTWCDPAWVTRRGDVALQEVSP